MSSVNTRIAECSISSVDRVCVIGVYNVCALPAVTAWTERILNVWKQIPFPANFVIVRHSNESNSVSHNVRIV